jgi:hypothetical protein
VSTVIETCLHKMLINRDVKGAEEYDTASALRSPTDSLVDTPSKQSPTFSKTRSICRSLLSPKRFQRAVGLCVVLQQRVLPVRRLCCKASPCRTCRADEEA